MTVLGNNNSQQARHHVAVGDDMTTTQEIGALSSLRVQGFVSIKTHLTKCGPFVQAGLSNAIARDCGAEGHLPDRTIVRYMESWQPCLIVFACTTASCQPRPISSNCCVLSCGGRKYLLFSIHLLGIWRFLNFDSNQAMSHWVKYPRGIRTCSLYLMIM